MDRVKWAAIVAFLAVLGTPLLAAQGPCGGVGCEGKGADAQRLQNAWAANATTSAQRDMMSAIIQRHTVEGVTDWKSSADEYFAWRWGQNADYNPEYEKPLEKPDFGVWRRNAERAVRSRLVDPDSAQFQWPNGFMIGTWKPILGKRVSGWVTCGIVNAKNRMGGYTGASYFVVVMNSGTVSFLDMDDGNNFKFVEASCRKSSFPSPQSGMRVQSRQDSEKSVADEIAKLANLRDRGVITEGEFQAQKHKLLGDDQ